MGSGVNSLALFPGGTAVITLGGGGAQVVRPYNAQLVNWPDVGFKSQVQRMDLMDGAMRDLEVFHHVCEHLNERADVVGGPGAPAEAVRDGIQVGLTANEEVGALGQALAQHVDGVLAGAVLPGGAARIAEVDVDATLLGQRGVVRHFHSLLVGEGLAHGRGHVEQLGAEGFQRRGGVRVRHLCQKHQSGLAAFHQHRNGRAVGRSRYVIAFPVARQHPVIGFRLPHVMLTASTGCPR